MDDLEPRGDDAEAIYERPQPPGPPVDPPDEPHRTVFATVTARQVDRRPIMPAWVRSAEDRSTVLRWLLRHSAYTTAYHATRSPKYLGKVAFWAPVGAVTTLLRVLRWATAEEGNWGLRQHAASRGDVDAYLKLDHTRERQASWRWWVVGIGAALAAVAVILLLTVAPWWGRWVALAVAAPALAWTGRPADRPITDRVVNEARFVKLTAEMVRQALLSLGIAGLKDPAAVKFPEEIHRDGPGYRAVVDLPHGVEAVEVVKRRGRLASGLRLPLDQVWPETVAGAHTGRLAVWVGYEPASRMRQPEWPLLRRGRVDIFQPFPFATDHRLRTVTGSLMYRNWLIGAMPGAGKTFALRLLLLAASLDPRVDLRGYELKGSGDLDALEDVCSEFGSGIDDGTVEDALLMLRWLRQECERRGPIIKRMARAGKAPENKVTPELAGISDLGLRPVVAFVDECQNLFAHDQHGAEAGKLAEQVIKLGRALGIILLLATQRPDKDSLPKGISANAGVRFCLRVTGQVENDMVLGTSMYQEGIRATQFGDDDLGWGWLVGQGRPTAAHGFYVDGDAAKRVVARALQLRGGPEPETVRRVRTEAYNLLADVRRVWIEGEEALWSELIVPRLAVLRPDLYGEWDVRTFGAAMKAAGVTTVSIHRKLDGKPVTRYGVRLDELQTALAARPGPVAIDD